MLLLIYPYLYAGGKTSNFLARKNSWGNFQTLFFESINHSSFFKHGHRTLIILKLFFFLFLKKRLFNHHNFHIIFHIFFFSSIAPYELPFATAHTLVSVSSFHFSYSHFSFHLFSTTLSRLKFRTKDTKRENLSLLCCFFGECHSGNSFTSLD